jgi:hypothetical protein
VDWICGLEILIREHLIARGSSWHD